MAGENVPTFAFLYRTETGRIDRPVWWRGFWQLAVPLIVLTIGWFLLAPYAQRDIAQQDALIAPATLAAYIYLLLYTFAVILIAISFYNLSAKRFRDHGRPGSLAGLVPLFALIAGAAHWLQPRVSDSIPIWIVYILDAVLVVAIVATLYECGFGETEG